MLCLDFPKQLGRGSLTKDINTKSKVLPFMGYLYSRELFGC